MKIKKIFVLIAVLFSVHYAFGIEFHGRATNSVYSFEDTTNHTKLYQYVRFTIEQPQFSNFCLNASFRALTDFSETLDNEQRYKAYNLNLQFKKIFNRLDLTLGRQFLHPGTILGGLDGLFSRFTISRNIKFAAYGGVEAHFQRSLEIYKPEDSFVWGGLLEVNRFFASNFQFFYLQKANKNNIFWHLTGLNLRSTIIPLTNLYIQAHYDLENSRLHRLLLSTRHQINKKLSFGLGFKSQYPQVYANSFFTIFEIEAYRQYRFSCSYNLMRNYFISAQYRLLQFDTENANQLFLTVNNTNGSIGLIYESGYAGEQVGLMCDYMYAITPSLTASLSIDYSRYKTEKIYEFDNELANALRVSYHITRHWLIDLEYQWLTNRFKDQDSRILNHIHYSW